MRPLELPIAPSGRPLTQRDAVRLLTADAGRSAARWVRRRRRNRALVSKEYDEGAWRQIVEERRWEAAPSLESFLVGTSRLVGARKIDGRLLWLPDDEYSLWRISAIQSILAAAAPGTEEIVEVGCGFGLNLFSLALAGRWPQLIGLDISENALAAGRQIAAHFGVNAQFRPIDLTQPDHPGFKALTGKTVFTYLCLEQLPDNLEGALQGILAARPKRVVHVESAVGLLSPWRPLDLVNELYVRSRDYQTRLVPLLDGLAADGSIKLLERQRLAFGPTCHHDPALLVWEPQG